MTVWTKRQLLNTDGWTSTSGQLLANDTVRAAVSAKLVDALFQRVDVAEKLKQQLPDQLQAAAPVLAGAVENLAPRAANAVLGTNAAQTLWEQANRRMHEQLKAVLRGEKIRNVSTANGDVTLDLRPLVHSLADRLGIADEVKANAPPNAGVILIMRANKLEAAQKAVRVIKALTIFLIIVVLALYALALWLARPSRRKVLGGIGGCIFGVGLLLLIFQRLLGNVITDSLVKVDANKPAGHEIWQIVTSELRDIGIALIVYGLVAIAGSDPCRAESRRRHGAALARARLPAERRGRLRGRRRDPAHPRRLGSSRPGPEAARDTRALRAHPVGRGAPASAVAARIPGDHGSCPSGGRRARVAGRAASFVGICRAHLSSPSSCLLVLPGPWNIVGFVVVTLLWFGELFLWSRTVKRKRRVVGAETLIGQIAIVTEACRPVGQVRLDGETWEANCQAGANRDDRVRVIGRDELTLIVEPA